MAATDEAQFTVKVTRAVGRTLADVARAAGVTRLDVTRAVLLLACGQRPKLSKPLVDAFHQSLPNKARGPTGPEPTMFLTVRIPSARVADIEAAAQRAQMSRHEWMRMILTITCRASELPSQADAVFNRLGVD